MNETAKARLTSRGATKSHILSAIAVVVGLTSLWVSWTKQRGFASEKELLQDEIRDLQAEVEPIRRLASRNYPELDTRSARKRLVTVLSNAIPSGLPLVRRQALISALNKIPMPRHRIEVQAQTFGPPEELGKGLETIFREALWTNLAFAVVWPGQPGIRGIHVHVQKRSLIPEADRVAAALDKAWSGDGIYVGVREDSYMGNDHIAILIGPK